MSASARVWVVSISAVVIILSGVRAGAILSEELNKKKVVTAYMEMTPAEQIAQLQATRERLVNQRRGIEEKLEEIVKRQQSVQ